MADTKIDIASRASIAVGANPITAFDGTSAEAVVAAQHYEATLERSLAGRWRWATAQAVLNRLEATPVGRWAYGFQLPGNLLLLHTVTRAGQPVAYDRYGDKVFANENDDLVADYTFRPDEAVFPPLFKFAFEVELQAVFAGAVVKDFDLAKGLRAEAEDVHWPKARAADAQQQTTRRVRPSRLIAVRRR